MVLASSPVCRVQAMRVGRHAWSMQYHVEVEPDTVANWGKVPAYKAALEATLGSAALGDMDRAAGEAMPEFIAGAERLYRNFRDAIA